MLTELSAPNNFSADADVTAATFSNGTASVWAICDAIKGICILSFRLPRNGTGAR